MNTVQLILVRFRRRLPVCPAAWAFLGKSME